MAFFTQHIERSTGSGSSVLNTISGTIDDSNLTFGFARKPLIVNVNGAFYTETGGAITWTWSSGGSSITLSSPVGLGGSIWALA